MEKSSCLSRACHVPKSTKWGPTETTRVFTQSKMLAYAVYPRTMSSTKLRSNFWAKEEPQNGTRINKVRWTYERISCNFHASKQVLTEYILGPGMLENTEVDVPLTFKHLISSSHQYSQTDKDESGPCVSSYLKHRETKGKWFHFPWSLNFCDVCMPFTLLARPPLSKPAATASSLL